jgi:RNA polymerase sigma factor (sigma-70 family)
MNSPVIAPAEPRGQRGALSAERRELAERYLPMAMTLAKRHEMTWPEARDDFKSAACLALVEAAEAYDPTRQVKFPTYARYRITGALLDVKRHRTALGWRSTFDEAPVVTCLSGGYDHWGRVFNIEPDPPIGTELERAEAVEELLQGLPPRYAAACRQIYIHGLTHAEAATRLGCSQSRLSFMHRQAIAMLKANARHPRALAPESESELELELEPA